MKKFKAHHERLVNKLDLQPTKLGFRRDVISRTPRYEIFHYRHYRRIKYELSNKMHKIANSMNGRPLSDLIAKIKKYLPNVYDPRELVKDYVDLPNKIGNYDVSHRYHDISLEDYIEYCRNWGGLLVTPDYKILKLNAKGSRHKKPLPIKEYYESISKSHKDLRKERRYNLVFAKACQSLINTWDRSKLKPIGYTKEQREVYLIDHPNLAVNISKSVNSDHPRSRYSHILYPSLLENKPRKLQTLLKLEGDENNQISA